MRGVQPPSSRHGKSTKQGKRSDFRIMIGSEVEDGAYITFDWDGSLMLRVNLFISRRNIERCLFLT